MTPHRPQVQTCRERALIASAMVFSLLIKPKAKKAVVGEEYIIEDK